MAQKTLGPTVTMTETSLPSEISYSRSTLVNGEPTDITFAFKSNHVINVEDMVQFVLPRPLSFSEATKCVGSNYWAKGDLKCNKSGDQLTVNITMSINGRYWDYEFFNYNVLGRKLSDSYMPSNPDPFTQGR